MKERQNEGEEHKEGNNVHLWFWWKSSERGGHLAWHIFTVHWILLYLVVFHISPRLFVLHGPLESLTTNLATAKRHQHTPMQLNSPPEQIFNKLYACIRILHSFHITRDYHETECNYLLQTTRVYALKEDTQSAEVLSWSWRVWFSTNERKHVLLASPLQKLLPYITAFTTNTSCQIEGENFKNIFWQTH